MNLCRNLVLGAIGLLLNAGCVWFLGERPPYEPTPFPVVRAMLLMAGRPNLQASLLPGARIVSYVWDMGAWQPDAVRTIDRRRILLWRIRGSSGAPASPGDHT